jgi:hypothetical protein
MNIEVKVENKLQGTFGRLCINFLLIVTKYIWVCLDCHGKNTFLPYFI